jgi:hypothetical protein
MNPLYESAEDRTRPLVSLAALQMAVAAVRQAELERVRTENAVMRCQIAIAHQYESTPTEKTIRRKRRLELLEA